MSDIDKYFDTTKNEFYFEFEIEFFSGEKYSVKLS